MIASDRKKMPADDGKGRRMRISDFHYDLPEDRIAQFPPSRREMSRLMVACRNEDSVQHRYFHDVYEYLLPGDLLVLNVTKVIPARLKGRKETTGGRIEILLVRELDRDRWEALVYPGRRIKPGLKVIFPDSSLKAELAARMTGGAWRVDFSPPGLLPSEMRAKVGSVPLPPYIRREPEKMDRVRYQTVYAKHDGSVAAPTAGLHFTRELLDRIAAKGVFIGSLTLHVGPGTFLPVKADAPEEHRMHPEYFRIDRHLCGQVKTVRERGGRVIAVGTTSVRALESAVDSNGVLRAMDGWTELFIYPPYRFGVVDAMITNFHLPRSTLLMLVAAFWGKTGLLELYRLAIMEGYRFYSYGDAMFLH